MVSGFSSKRVLDFDMPQREEVRPTKRQNFYAQESSAQNENDRKSLKRSPDFNRPDRETKYFKNSDDFFRPIAEIESRHYTKISEVDPKISNAVYGAHLLTACINNNEDAANEALNKIQSFEGLMIQDMTEKQTAFTHASVNEMLDVTIGIRIKVREYFYNAVERDDRHAIANIKAQFDLNSLLVGNYLETDEQRDKVNNIILGSQLIEACKNENEDKARELLSKITSYDGLCVRDEKGKNAYILASENIELAFLKKVREFEYDAHKNQDFATLRAIEERFDFETLYRYN